MAPRADAAAAPRTRRRLISWIAAVAATALVVTLAVVAAGFDARETPREDPSVWVERTAGQYARVNTETAEIDTVRSVEGSSGVVQTSGLGLLLTQGFGRAVTINASMPRDVRTQGQGSQGASETTDQAATDPTATDTMRTPDGTIEVLAARDAVLFVTRDGEASLSRVSTGVGAAGNPLAPTLESPVLLDPRADERDAGDAEVATETTTDRSFFVDAAAITDEGLVALYSRAAGEIRWFDAATVQWRAVDEVPEVAVAETGETLAFQLAIVDDAWVLFDRERGTLWREGLTAPVELESVGTARLQASSVGLGDAALVADEAGLWQVDADGSAARVADASGAPAQPRQVGDAMVASWVGASAGTLWSSDRAETVPLEVDAAPQDATTPDVEIRSNGSRAVVVERSTGMLWTVPEGRLIPVEQWSLVDPPKQETGTVVTQDVTEQEPPVAVDDTFGVRPGEPTLLPVLLNDYDPNRKDVLTVVAEGPGGAALVDGAGAEFGTVSLLSDGQAVMVQPSAAALGSASFTYRITDGAAMSEPATVTLTAVGETVNTAPEWCAVEGCQRAWPSPELAPGGTLIMPILEGWVDAEGDPMMLASARSVNADDPVRVLVTADGTLAVRHTDPNAPAGDVVVAVRVADTRGAETERELRIRVRPGAAMEFSAAAITVKTGEPTVVRPLERVIGGSGSLQLVDAVVQQGAASVTVNPGSATFEVGATAPGGSLIGVTVRDTVTEQDITGVMRVTAVESRGGITVPPLRAFVRSLADSTVDVLAAIPGSLSRALTVQSATVREGQLRADVIEHARVRVAGSTADGQPGRIGAIDVVVAEGEHTGQGRLTVFQVDGGSSGAIAVADTATVRAGSVVDIAVLENDVAPPGERLVLHPEVTGSGAAGELAFASGSTLRYLAPATPGIYTLSYQTSGASHPELGDVGQVRVTVLAAGANRDPQPATVTVRVAPGERVTATIPLSGVDPDGDRLRLVSVDSPADPQLSTQVVARSNSVQVAASASAERGTHVVGYTVRDAFGGEAQGRLRVMVTEPDGSGSAPVVYSDYVRMVFGATEPAVVRPLDNDLDPSGGTLELVSVVPNVPGGAASLQYQQLADRLDLTSLDDGVVRIHGGDELGTVSFTYTVRSTLTTSTADGLIVVQVSERVGLQAPVVTDTVLSVRDRADFSRVGVDVVTDRVRWAAGDASTLSLSLWGSAAERYRVSGNHILGTYQAEGDLVVFRLAGTDAMGADVETFGFLVVPPLDELRLTLAQGATPLTVAEGESIDVRVTDLLDLGPGDRAELDTAALAVQRPQARCVALNELTVRYSAGREAPWSDTCTIRVKLAEQHTYTVLPVPISIVPDAPVAQLNPLTRTLAPGATETIGLTDMLQWQGGREGRVDQLRWQVTGGATSFEVAQTDAQLRVTARADAVPGSQQQLTVAVTGAGDSQAALTLRVGEAAIDAPRGGTVSLQCTVGSPCTTPLVGVAGEHDPFAGKTGGGLTLVSVDAATCQVGALQAVGNAVQVSWADPRGPGGSCTARFTVHDAQQRIGTGTIELDAQGVPRAPASIVPSGANATSVQLTVTLADRPSHPETTSVEVLSLTGTVVATCTPTDLEAQCWVEGVPVGKAQGRQYLARAVNAVGPSDLTRNPSRATWAYVPPAAPTVTAQVTKDSANTSTTQGEVTLRVEGSERASRFLLTVTPNHTGGAPVQIERTSTHRLPPGITSFSVIPQDPDLPPGYDGSTDGAAGEARNVTIGAAPIVTGAQLTQPDPSDATTARLTHGLNENFASEVTLTYGISAPNSASPSGTLAACTSTSPEFTGLTPGTYIGTVCAQSEFGRTVALTSATWLGGDPDPVVVSSGYRIAADPVSSGNSRDYTRVADYSIETLADATVRFALSDGTTQTGTLAQVPVGVTVQVQQCVSTGGGERCSTPVSLPANGPAATRVTFTGSCVPPGGDPAAAFTIEGRPFGDAQFTPQGTDQVRVSWSSTPGHIAFSDAVFTGVMCDDPGPPPDPGG